jgi:hypothetical protein
MNWDKNAPVHEEERIILKWDMGRHCANGPPLHGSGDGANYTKEEQ